MAVVGAAVRVELDGAAATVTLDRPEKRNALSLALMEELIDALRRVSRTPGVRAIVLAGAGPAFSAGHDLGEMVGRDRAFYDRLFDVCTELMETIHRLPQPVIAKVHGIATAAGCQLVAACDLAVAAEGARFATPGVKIGLFCSTPMVPAAECGLVNRVVPAEQLDAAVQELVAAVARSSPLTVGIGKEAFYAQIELDEHGAYGLTKDVMSTNSLAADAQEGMCAFLEKRPPTWTGE